MYSSVLCVDTSCIFEIPSSSWTFAAAALHICLLYQYNMQDLTNSTHLCSTLRVDACLKIRSVIISSVFFVFLIVFVRFFKLFSFYEFTMGDRVDMVSEMDNVEENISPKRKNVPGKVSKIL